MPNKDSSVAWRTLNESKIYQNPVLSLLEVSREPPRGQSHRFSVIHCPDWVNVLALTPDSRVVLIRQWRQGSCLETLEIPGGLVDPGEDPETAALRELEEETGYQPEKISFLGSVSPNPALFNNRCHTFMATGCRPLGEMHLDDSERIEVVLKQENELMSLVKRGEIDHGLIVAALSFYWLEKKS